MAAPSGPLEPMTPPGPPRTRPPGRWNRAAIMARALRVGLGILATIAGFGFVVWLGSIGVYNLRYAERLVPALWQGFVLSAVIVAAVIPIGFAIGFFVGWARTLRNPIIRGIASVYVDFFRSMPPIVLIAFAFLLGLVALRTTITDFFLLHSIVLWLGVLALAFHTAAYQAEIVRAGILSVPAAQTEAAESIGLTRGQTMLRVVLPQAFRVSLPALGNEFSSVIKDTSLLSVIGWLELSGLALVQIYSGILVYPYAPIIIWLEVAVFYFAITFALNSTVRALENSFKVPGLEAAHP
jgi:His/Glu/Gln/Arg/opine family amino acid ABC transporter permease subunit